MENQAVKVLEQKSEIDRSEPVEAELSAAEIAEFKEHFQFLAKHRKILKLKTNSQEELLLSGAREPERRGVCLHLLKKVDRQSVSSALTRVQDPKLKTSFLAGLVRFYPDIQTVLAYLESLKQTVSRDEAATALSAGLTRLDFSQVSSAQMRRVLDLSVSMFDKAVLPQVMLGLLGSDTFRKALDGSLEDLPSALREIVEPLRVLYPVVWKGHRRGLDLALVEQGLLLVMQMPDSNLRRYPERIRERLVEACLLLEKTEGRIERGVNILLETFTKSGRVYSSLAMKRVGSLLGSGQEGKAKKVLSQLTTSQPDFQQPKKWLGALERPRLGRTALVEAGEGTTLETIPTGQWQLGFSFEHQVTVWVDTARVDDPTTFRGASELHKRLVMPQVVPILEGGTSGSTLCFRVLPMTGKPALQVLKKGKLRGIEVLRLARDAAAIIAGAQAFGVTLSRLMHDDCHVDSQGRLWVARLSHAQDGTDSQSAFLAAQDWLKMLMKMSRDKVMLQKIRLAGEQADDLSELLMKLALI
ncbi:MAG: hypothetical protein HOI23_18495 [Deltaproteobacteria bacterium]|nr:hypothetical protein [Deltaproteobacteria bacterium]